LHAVCKKRRRCAGPDRSCKSMRKVCRENEAKRLHDVRELL
jgi:hypothetical protein